MNKIGNLILISENNNVKFGNLDFKEKKKLYFQSDIEPFRHSLKVMNSYDRWDSKKILIETKRISFYLNFVNTTVGQRDVPISLGQSSL